jgi:gliding motility-associated lipoprotein GldH
MRGWDKSDTLAFDIPAVKQAGAYKEDVGLRVVNTYPFQRLSLVIKQTIHPSGYVHSDTVTYTLFDRRGNTKGHGVSFYQYHFHFNTLQLREGDSLHICIKHNMKREIMPGIADVGIRVDRESTI